MFALAHTTRAKRGSLRGVAHHVLNITRNSVPPTNYYNFVCYRGRYYFRTVVGRGARYIFYSENKSRPKRSGPYTNVRVQIYLNTRGMFIAVCASGRGAEGTSSTYRNGSDPPGILLARPLPRPASPPPLQNPVPIVIS
jgi:hypothetical protein